MIEKSPQLQTQERILNAAEYLYIKKGINATSLRDITRHANVNLSAVNYYFISKNRLTQALFLHHFLPYILHCEDILRNINEKDGLEAILDALIVPLKQLAEKRKANAQQTFCLICRIGNEYPDMVREQIAENAGKIIELLKQLLHKHLPGLTEEILRCRLFFIFKLIFHGLNGNDPFMLFCQKPDKSEAVQDMLDEMRSFIRAGLLAPISI